jgi:hypothetical protein
MCQHKIHLPLVARSRLRTRRLSASVISPHLMETNYGVLYLLSIPHGRRSIRLSISCPTHATRRLRRTPSLSIPRGETKSVLPHISSRDAESDLDFYPTTATQRRS